MSSEAIGGIAALVLFGFMWVVLPSLIHKRRQEKGTEALEE